MAQTLDQLKNPWGAQAGPGSPGLDAQRSDLFTVDFSIPLRAIRGILSRNVQSQLAGALLQALPDQLNLPYFASAVEVPESRIGSSSSKRHEVHVPWPGAEEQPGQVAITFIQDVCQGESMRSGILSFLRAWRAVVRAGRPGQSAGDLSLDLLGASQDGRSLIPDFKHPFSIYLWRGRIPELSPLSFSDAQTPASDGVEMCGQWSVVRGWLSGFQPGALRHASSGIQEIRAVFQAEAVVETGTPIGTVSIGTPRVVG